MKRSKSRTFSDWPFFIYQQLLQPRCLKLSLIYLYYQRKEPAKAKKDNNPQSTKYLLSLAHQVFVIIINENTTKNGGG